MTTVDAEDATVGKELLNFGKKQRLFSEHSERAEERLALAGVAVLLLLGASEVSAIANLESESATCAKKILG